MKKTISVIIPIHNQELELNKCLNSVCNQTFIFPYEIICVLDQSNNISYDIVNSYKNLFGDKIKIIECNFQDAGLTRNLGIREATGDYIFFLDSDDYISEDCLEKLYQAATTTNADLIIANYGLSKRNSKIINEWNISKFYLPGTYDKEAVLAKYLKDFRIRGYVWNKLYKRELIVNLGIKFLPSKLTIEDRPFLLEYIINSNKIHFIKDTTYVYIQHRSSFVKSTNKLIFMQKYINCDYACKVILIKHHLFSQEDFEKSLLYRRTSLLHDAKKLDNIHHYKNKIVKQVGKQLEILLGDNLFVYNAPWESTILCLNYNLKYDNLAKSKGIFDLRKFL